MKTTMRMADLKKSDGFPVNIDRNKTVVVQIPKFGLGKILYSNKDGEYDDGRLPIETREKFAPGLYIIQP